jgi:FAD/FMN-containing dehydrogenase
MTLVNFGRNVRFEPAALVAVTDRNDVLAQLEQFRGRNIRAIGALHSWSDTARGDDVVVDVSGLNSVTLDKNAGRADVGAGCTIDRLLDALAADGYTLPAYGIIGRQTLAGAMSTATHGSGPSSLSHYVTSVSLATYDARGVPRIVDQRDGEALLAARCALGCAGIVVSATIRVEPDFLIEEKTRWFEWIDQVLERERDYPRTQFYLVPWSWRWYAQLRRPRPMDSAKVPNLTARIQRLFRKIGVDVLLNGAVKLLAVLRWRRAIHWFFRRLFPLVARDRLEVVDRSREILQMRHDLYRHVEMELFVRERYVRRASAFVEWVLRWCDGESAALPAPLRGDDFGCDAAREIQRFKGTYTHDYLITFRRVSTDASLISMTSSDDDEAWYAISLITYQNTLEPFTRMARFLAAAMAHAYRARPHWGKLCPLTADEIATLYPALSQFRDFCDRNDPDQAFVNDFARRTIGFRDVRESQRTTVATSG